MPECEFDGNNRNIPYNQPWLNNAIPFTNGKYDNCHRYAAKNWTDRANDHCGVDMFDKSLITSCDTYIYATDERNIQTEVNNRKSVRARLNQID